MGWISRKKRVNLECPISERINAPLYLRLIRYKEVKRLNAEVVEWAKRHSEDLTVSWHNYMFNIKKIGYMDYCRRFYTGTLEGAFGYKGSFK